MVVLEPAGGAKKPANRRSSVLGSGDNTPDKDHSSWIRPCTFRAGIYHLLTSNKNITQTAGIGAVTQLKGDVQETFEQLDLSKDGNIDQSELGGCEHNCFRFRRPPLFPPTTTTARLELTSLPPRHSCLSQASF